MSNPDYQFQSSSEIVYVGAVHLSGLDNAEVNIWPRDSEHMLVDFHRSVDKFPQIVIAETGPHSMMIRGMMTHLLDGVQPAWRIDVYLPQWLQASAYISGSWRTLNIGKINGELTLLGRNSGPTQIKTFNGGSINIYNGEPVEILEAYGDVELFTNSQNFVYPWENETVRGMAKPQSIWIHDGTMSSLKCRTFGLSKIEVKGWVDKVKAVGDGAASLYVDGTHPAAVEAEGVKIEIGTRQAPEEFDF